jgi:hypothetical protein
MTANISKAGNDYQETDVKADSRKAQANYASKCHVERWGKWDPFSVSPYKYLVCGTALLDEITRA